MEIAQKTNYGMKKAAVSLPARDLLRVPHKGGELVVGYPAFGPSTYNSNIQEMQREYSHSVELPQISFRGLTTSESISVVAYDFGNLAKPQILDGGLLQLGRIVRTSEGVFVNPIKDEQGRTIVNEEALKVALNGAKKVNGIYLCDNDFGFASYDTFKQGVQDCDTFAEGGLARVLEHTEGKVAENLRVIVSSKFYKKGVNVAYFDKLNEPILRVAVLCSEGVIIGRLFVGDNWNDRGNGGYAFGGLNSAEGST